MCPLNFIGIFFADAMPNFDAEETLCDSEATQPSSEGERRLAPKAANAKNKNSRKIIWKHILEDDQINLPSTPFSGQTVYESEYVGLPIHYFSHFISDDLKNTFVNQSNLYSLQKNISKPLNLSLPEFEQWLGIAMYFSLSKIPNTALHWSPNFCNEAVSGIMSRDRWMTIKANIHITDNQQVDPDNSLYKIRPLVNELKTKFKNIPMKENLCIDEQMVPFKGKSWLKQYIPKKPHKWGYKFFLLCDASGVVYDFIVYTGKIQPVDNPEVPDLGASSNSVLHLAQSIPHHRNHKLFFDNWFTSLPLISYLAKQGIWCCGTVQARRLPCLKFKPDTELKREGRGSKDVWKAEVEDVTVAAVKWQDTRSVCMVSTFLSHDPEDTCTRYDKKEGKTVEVSRPNLVAVYNQNMGGVDLQDQMISLYRMEYRSRKYYQRMIFHLFDMTVVNAWLLYRRDATSVGIPKSKQSGLSDFKLKIAFSLMKGGKDVIKRKGRPSSTSVETEYKKKKNTGNATKPIPQQDIRLDKVGHFP